MDKKQPPAPQQIKQARMDAGLTQTQAGQLLYKSCRVWQQYEKGDRNMDLAYWELFLIKTKAELINPALTLLGVKDDKNEIGEQTASIVPGNENRNC